MAKKAAEAAPDDKVLLYEKLVATHPKVERKGATVPYTSLNGHMFSYLSKDGKLALRLPDEARLIESILRFAVQACREHSVYEIRIRK